MYQSEDEVRRALSEGKLEPSGYPRLITITNGPATRPPERGDIWLIAGSPYIVSEVTTTKGRSGSLSTAKLRFLKDRLAPATPQSDT